MLLFICIDDCFCCPSKRGWCYVGLYRAIQGNIGQKWVNAVTDDKDAIDDGKDIDDYDGLLDTCPIYSLYTRTLPARYTRALCATYVRSYIHAYTYAHIYIHALPSSLLRSRSGRVHTCLRSYVRTYVYVYVYVYMRTRVSC